MTQDTDVAQIRKMLPAEAVEILDALAEQGMRIMVVDRLDFKAIVDTNGKSLIPEGTNAEATQRYLISVRMLGQFEYITSVGLGDDLYKITAAGRRIAESRTTTESSTYPRPAAERA